MDFMKVLANPIVIGGGAIIGIILLAKGGSVPVQSNNIDPATISAITQMNLAAMGQQVQLATIDGDVAKARYSLNATLHGQTLNYLENQNANYTKQVIQQNQSQAGITQAIIKGQTDVIIDQQQNTNRLAMGYVEQNKAKIAADASVDIARYQYKAAKADMFGNIIGGAVRGITGLATAATLPESAFGSVTNIGGGFSGNTGLGGFGGGSSTLPGPIMV